jgi:23S rRNA (cytidine1920-2'-O)/16S rRNA (cytidine1409-2'-O)-methyltransferase
LVKKVRLDALMVSQGLVETRAKAQALVMAGKVMLGDLRQDKAGVQVPPDANIVLKTDSPWVSRGAYKLLGAIDAFPWLADAMVDADCLDIGASTGGFTDVLLAHGARSVSAVDVGYGQLHWRIQSDPRVTVLDRTNIRTLEPNVLPATPSVATCDASFISVTLFMDVVWRELGAEGVFVVLVKPQFEAGRNDVGEGGVVRDESVRTATLERVKTCALEVGFSIAGAVDSPIHGPSGNREFLLVLRKVASTQPPGNRDSV